MARDTGGFKIDERFKKRMKGRFERFSLEAGVLKDKPHKEPRPAKPIKRKKTKVKKAEGQPVAKPTPKPKKKKKVSFKNSVKKAKKKLSNRFKSKSKRAAERHSAMVKSHAARGLGTMEGGPVRLKKASTKGTVMEVAEYVRKVHKIPYLTAPFQKENSPEMKALKREFFRLIVGRTKSYSKVESLLRNVIRLPFLKKRYGRNSVNAIRIKTFDRLGIDTGQFFRALEGRIRVNKNVP